MNKFLKISLCILSASFMLTACSDDDKWSPGPADNEVGVDAYFPFQDSEAILSPEEADYTIYVKRVDTSEAVSLPLIVESTNTNFTYPSTIDFAEGQSEASFVVNFANFPIGEFQTVKFGLPDDETDIYGPGMTELTLSVIVSNWALVSDNVKYFYNQVYFDNSGEKYWPTTVGEMYILEKTNIFKITDFFGSGLDVRFKYQAPSDDQAFTTQNLDFKGNVIDEKMEISDGSTVDAWYVYDVAYEDYPIWYPEEGNSTGIQYLYILGGGYSYVNLLSDPTTGFGWMNICCMALFTDSSAWSSYLGWQVTFNLKYNPFNETGNE